MLTASEKLENYRRRFGALLSASKIEEPLVRALYWKQRRWAAYEVCEGYGWGRLPEWNTLEYLDAIEDYAEAKREHAALVGTEWAVRMLNRLSDAALARTIAAANALVEPQTEEA